MLKLALTRLERERTLQVDGAIPDDDPLWEGSEFDFDGPVRVAMEATVAGSGEIVVRGTVQGTLSRQCRRCLDPVRTEVDEELTLVFAPADELETGDEDEAGAVRTLSSDDLEIDLAEVIRQELVLSTDRYVVCDPDCEGLCSQCGINLNQESCDCTLEEPDPRWDALRTLMND